MSKIAMAAALASLAAGCSSSNVRLGSQPMFAGSTPQASALNAPVTRQDLPTLQGTGQSQAGVGIAGQSLRERGWRTEGAPIVEVGAADTAQTLSQGYGVPVSVILEANGLQRADEVTPGQRLIIPTYVYREQPFAAPEATVAAAPPPVIGPGEPVAGPGAPPTTLGEQAREGRHVVQEGDTLYSIARAHRVPVSALASLNGVGTDYGVKIGERMRIPEPGLGGQQPTQVAKLDDPATTVVSDAAPEASAPAVAPAEVAATTPAESGPAAEASGFRWPVRGPIVSGFGKQADGARNDGINVSVPAGTPVHAAAEGTVIYAGDGLEGYGNLVLVQHEDDWVSAYAHNETLKVERGDKVSRGQPIASVGASGSVDEPQLHFELRKNSKPVDPLPHLAGA